MLQRRLPPCVHILKGMLLQGNPQLLIYPQPVTCDLHQQLCGMNICQIMQGASQQINQYLSCHVAERGAFGAVFLSNKKSHRFVSNSQAKCFLTSSLKQIGKENMPSQNVQFEDGKSLKTDLKIQLEKISLWPKNQLPLRARQSKMPEKYKNVATELL